MRIVVTYTYTYAYRRIEPVFPTDLRLCDRHTAQLIRIPG